MKIRKSILYILLLVMANGFGQELNLPVFTQYLADNNFVISPSYAGIGDNLKIRANALTQWVGIKDAPDNQSLYGDFRIADRTGVGLTLYNDKNGNTIQTGAKVSFAHHLILDYYSKQYLSFGISYNFNNFRIDVNKLDSQNINTTNLDDRRTPNNNFDLAVLYRNKGFFFSLNANNVLNKQLSDVVSELEPNLLLNYQVFSGYTIQGPKKSGLEYEPSIFYQMFSSDQRSGLDINFKFRKFNRKEDYYWAGISYRSLMDEKQTFKPLSVGPMIGFQKSKFYFAYAYQLTLTELSGYNSGTHLVTIGLNFLQGMSNCPCTKSPVH